LSRVQFLAAAAKAAKAEKAGKTMMGYYLAEKREKELHANLMANGGDAADGGAML